MVPFLFWLGAAASLVAAGIGVFGRRPALCMMGLVALMLTNSVIFFSLSAPLVALELVLGAVGVGWGFWMFFLRSGPMQLAAPGVERVSFGRLVCFLVVGGFGALLIATLESIPDKTSLRPSAHSLLPTWVGAWMALFLLCSVAVTTVFLIRSVRQSEKRERQ